MDTPQSQDETIGMNEDEKQIYYRDARSKGYYDKIWKNVGKCVLCDPREKYIFHEENEIVMTISMFAYIDGHFMIVPRRHISSPKGLTPTQWETVRKFMYISKKLVRKATGIKSVQFVQNDGNTSQGTVAGHMHIHCVPFDAPDLSTWNYRQLENTPLENVQNYRDLDKEIQTLGKRFDKKYGG